MTTTAQRLGDALLDLGHRGGDQRALLSSGKVWVRGLPSADPSRMVSPGDVEVRPRAPKIRVGHDPVLLWRDAHIAVIWKAPGLLSVPANGRKERNALGFVRQLLGAALPVHRLDEGTSGVLCVALTERAQEAVKALLESHEVERRYLAIVSGAPTWTENRIDLPLVRDRGDGLRGVWSPSRGAPDEAPPPDARPARTALRRLELLDHAALVEAQLHTGRTHQVRLHLNYLGHCILGDPLYGNRHVQGRSERLALHAAVLGFRHPITGEALRFEAPLPDDLEGLRRRLLRAEGERRPEGGGPPRRDDRPPRPPRPAGPPRRGR
jgi:23S rRNA pseudouridine1911/1915/1917 synthase